MSFQSDKKKSSKPNGESKTMGGGDSMGAGYANTGGGAAAPTRTTHRPSTTTRVTMGPPPPALTESEEFVVEQQKKRLQQLQHNTTCTQQNCDLEYGITEGHNEEILASAVMVANCSFITEEDSSFFPMGVEFDPDAKEKAHKRTIRAYYWAFAALLFATLVTGLVMGLVTKKDPVLTNKETDFANGYRETLGIQEVLENSTGLSLTKKSNTSTPYLQALDWIIHTDPTEPLPGDSNLLQRFIAAYFYFATSVDHEWAWCAPPTEYSSNTCTFQENVRYGLDIPKIIVGSRWLSGTDECTWVGLYCDEEKKIESINLSK